MPVPTSLSELRTFLGYRAESVARLTGLALDRVSALEAGEPPTLFEAERLAALYGVPPEAIEDVPLRLVPGDALTALAHREEFRTAGDSTRMRMVAAANAAREIVELEALESQADRRQSFKRQLPDLTFPRGLPDHRQGGEVAGKLRKALRLGVNPVESVRDLIRERFPAVVVLYAHLGGDGPAGLSFVDAVRGPAIVLNLDGKNTNPTVRRFSLVHELGHLLIDWGRSQQQPLAVISGYLSDRDLSIERRANAFAVRFLCPPSILRGLDPSASPVEAASRLRRFGIPYAAIRLYLRNEAGRELPYEPPPEVSSAGVGASWGINEDPGLNDFPLQEVAPERRTRVARAAARAYARGIISRDRFARALGVPPGANLEAVLAFFVLDPPDHAS
jgi:Zn-dependent peptidase ImmA (M78 family)